MKNGLRFVLLLSVICLSYTSEAQLKGFSIGPYVESAWPIGDFQTTHKNGLGAGLSADIKLPGGLGLTGSAGYMHFGGRVIDQTGERASAINVFPVRAGLKFRPIPLIYFKVESGAANFTNGGGSALIFSPGIGVRVLGIDVQGKYEAWFKDGTRSFWGLRAGINF